MRKMIKAIFVVSLLGFSISAEPAVVFEVNPWIEAVDTQNANHPIIQEAMKSGGEKGRTQAARALSKILTPQSITPLILLSKDSSERIQRFATFGLGQLGWKPEFTQGREQEILTRLKELTQSPRAKTRARAVNSIGKLGLDSTIANVRPFFTDKDKTVKGEAIMAVYRHRLVQRLKDPSKKFADLSDEVFADLTALSQNKNPSVKNHVAYLLARLKDKRGVEVLLKLAEEKNEWTQLYALQGLTALVESKALPLFVKSLSSPELAVQIAGAQGLAALQNAENLLNLAQNTASTHILVIAIDALPRLKELTDEQSKKRLEVLAARSKQESPGVRVSALKAWAMTEPSKTLEILEALIADNHFVVKEGAASLVGNLEAAQKTKWVAKLSQDKTLQVRVALLEALASDPTPESYALIKNALRSTELSERGTAVVALMERKEEMRFADGLQCYEQSVGDEKWVEVREGLVELFDNTTNDLTTQALQKVAKDPVASVAHKAVRALLKRGITDVPKVEPAKLSVSPFRELSFEENPIVKIETNKGSFTVELFAQEAPIHVGNFIGQVRAGLYNGLQWHRVVSNFVIQGGDPDDSGWGSAGYSLRAEINRVPFRRGALGMPRSEGFHTGGVQVFFNHIPTPHLDGQYTVFGQTIEGLEIIDLIERGDRILSVKEL